MRTQERSVTDVFDRYDKGRLSRALKKVKDKRTFLRLRAVLLVAEGMSVSTVAKLLGRTARAIYYWVDTYRQTHNPSALFEAPRSGRPLTAEAITEERILSALKENPLHWAIALRHGQWLYWQSTLTTAMAATSLPAHFGDA